MTSYSVSDLFPCHFFYLIKTPSATSLWDQTSKALFTWVRWLCGRGIISSFTGNVCGLVGTAVCSERGNRIPGWYYWFDRPSRITHSYKTVSSNYQHFQNMTKIDFSISHQTYRGRPWLGSLAHTVCVLTHCNRWLWHISQTGSLTSLTVCLRRASLGFRKFNGGPHRCFWYRFVCPNSTTNQWQADRQTNIMVKVLV